MQDGQVFVGRNHIHAIRFDLHAVGGLGHRHLSGPLQQFWQHAFVSRVQVLNDDECRTTGNRDRAKKLFQGFQAPG